MARSRKELAYEVGGMGYSLVMLDLAEVGFQKGRETYRFEGEAFTGGNINRFGVKFEGEGAFGGRLDDLELQALYSRAIAPYWNLQAGVRHDIKPDPSRTYLVAGVEGIAPYWFKVNAATFLSNKGEVRARVEASYDQRITQKPISLFRIFRPSALALACRILRQACVCVTRSNRNSRPTSALNGANRRAQPRAFQELQAKIPTR
jgi:copper resistance protein B